MLITIQFTYSDFMASKSGSIEDIAMRAIESRARDFEIMGDHYAAIEYVANAIESGPLSGVGHADTQYTVKAQKLSVINN